MYASQFRYLRHKLGYTQSHLAVIANLDIKTVQRAESGHRVSSESLLALCSALKTTPSALHEERDEKTHASNLTVIRSGRDDDQIDLIPEFQEAVRGAPGLEYLVLAQQYQPIGLLDESTGRYMVFIAACFTAIGLVFVNVLRMTNVNPIFVYLGYAIVGLMLLLAVLQIKWAHRESEDSQREQTKNRAYAIGKNRIHEIYIDDETVNCRVFTIDPRLHVNIVDLTQGIRIDFPTDETRRFLNFLPDDPRIRKLMIDDRMKVEIREIPRLSKAAVSAA